MGTRRRGVALTPMETRHDIILRTAQLADELGYEAFALPEGWGLDSTLLLTEAASRTRRIRLVSGILSVWGRTPGTLAMTAATLHRLSGGRFVLGLGPSTRALVEGFHGLRFTHPADKLREVTTKVRALLAGERALLDGTPGARPLRLGQPPALGRARRAAGRPEPLTVAAGPWTVAAADAGTARGVVASCVAWYLTAMGDVYGRTVAGQGHGAAVRAVQAANPRPRPDGGVVPDQARVLLEAYTAHGTPAQVREQLEPWDGAADLTLMGLPPNLPWDPIETTLRAAAP